MYRLFTALILCGAMFLVSPATAQAHGGCGYGGGYGYGYGGYGNVGFYPRVSPGFYGPALYGPRYGSFGGFGGYRGFGAGYGGGYRGYRGGGSFISFGFGF